MPPDFGINSKLSALLQYLIGATITLPSESLDARITALEAASASLVDQVGAVTGDATTTVLGRLAAIESLLKCVCGDFPPGASDVGGCDSPATTLDSHYETFSDIVGRVFPVWSDPLPDGLSVDGTGELADAHIAVTLSDSTGVYSYYVQSRAPSHQRTSGATTEYSNNQWLPLSPGDNLAISVPVGFTAKVYLCYTPAAGFTECVNIGSLAGSYTQLDTSAVFNSSYAVWSSIPGAVTTDSEAYGGHTFQWDNSVAVLIANANGWTFTKNSGPDIRLLAKRPDGSFTSYTISSTPITISGDTTSLWCDLGSGGSTEAFSFQVCPPA